MITRSLALSFALAVAFAAASVFPGGAVAGPGIGGFGVRPAHANPNNPATRAYFVRSVPTGGSFTDQVVVTNSASRPVRLRVYAVDGLTGVTSGAVYSNRNDKLHKAGLWVTPAVSLVRVDARSQALVPFEVRVPSSASPGDHLAGLAFENTSRQRSGGRFSVTEIVRAVIGIEIQVPGSAFAQVQLRGASLKALPGTQIPSVIVNLGDSGLRLCKPVLAVALAGSGGRQPVVRRALDTILPGDYIPFPLPWPRPLRSGIYRASVTASGCGHGVRTSAVARLGSSLSGTTAHPGFITAGKAGGTPWWLIPLVALAGIAAGVFLTLRLSRGRPRGVPTST